MKDIYPTESTSIFLDKINNPPVYYGFENIYAHSGITVIFKNNTIYLYSDKCISPDLLKKLDYKEIILNDENLIKKYDKLISSSCLDEGPIFNALGRYIQNNNQSFNTCYILSRGENFTIKLGYYFKEFFGVKNILFLKDYTHSVDGVEFLISFMNDAFSKNKKRIKIKKVITIGADPEFEIIENDEFVPANTVFNTGSDREIGCDGAACTGEFRPKYATTIKSAVKNLKGLITEASKQVQGISVAGNYVALGGHIHFGNVGRNDEFVKILDFYIGFYTIDKSGEKRGQYRRLSSSERKNWGFEYRTPPAMIYKKPQYYYLWIKIAKNLADNFYIKNIKIVYYTNPLSRPTKEEYKEYCGLNDHDLKILEEFKKETLYSDNIFKYWVNGYKENNLIIKYDGCFDSNIKGILYKNLLGVVSKNPFVILFLSCPDGYFNNLDIDGFINEKLSINYKYYIGIPYIYRASIRTMEDKLLLTIKNKVIEWVNEQ